MFVDNYNIKNNYMDFYFKTNGMQK